MLLRWRMVAPLVTPPPVTPCTNRRTGIESIGGCPYLLSLFGDLTQRPLFAARHLGLQRPRRPQILLRRLDQRRHDSWGWACERLTKLGIAVNLVTYLTGGGAMSANNVTNFLGTSFMLCFLGGFVADTFLERYLTIGIFTSVQALDNSSFGELHSDRCLPVRGLS
ncbi:hypothetical protein CASFOL_010633 [Castilleja foliolosa]|uniref:Uncharacterized protein n=1 Tax=Castilleja foliolosa TaxID=1961234 RepID=A0ABD3DTP0_9LAMI